MTQVSFVQRAPENTVFSPGCFDDQIGQQIPFNFGGRTVMATLVDAKILPSGEGVALTLDVPGFPTLPVRPGDFSIVEES